MQHTIHTIIYKLLRVPSRTPLDQWPKPVLPLGKENFSIDLLGNAHNDHNRLATTIFSDSYLAALRGNDIWIQGIPKHFQNVEEIEDRFFKFVKSASWRYRRGESERLAYLGRKLKRKKRVRLTVLIRRTDS